MSRAIYRILLWLHPPFFRKRFADEMLWLFDETVSTEGAAALLLDGLASLLRQWLLRRMTWRFAAAVAGALLQVGIVAALTADHAARTAPVRGMNPAAAAAAAPASVTSTSSAITATTPVGDAPLVFMLFFGIVLVYAFQRRRRPPMRRHCVAMTSGNDVRVSEVAGAKRSLSIIPD